MSSDLELVMSIAHDQYRKPGPKVDGIAYYNDYNISQLAEDILKVAIMAKDKEGLRHLVFPNLYKAREAARLAIATVMHMDIDKVEEIKS